MLLATERRTLRLSLVKPSGCDYIIELGPGGGTDGGSVIAQGTPEELRKNMQSNARRE